MKPLFFVHIPKTAGTSFRLAAQQYFGGKKVVCDYGADAPETAELVREGFYVRQDNWQVYQRMCSGQKRLLSGHVPAKRYIGGFTAPQTVTFLREPLQRVYSEYQHQVRQGGVSGSFRDYFSQRQKMNQQARMFQWVPLEAVGFVGLTEAYNESLEMLNNRYGLKLKTRAENLGRDSLARGHDIRAEDIEAFNQLNEQDLRLYRLAVSLFKQRRALYEQKRPYVHGKLVDATERKVTGWAFWEGEPDAPVELDIRINGEVVTTTHARRLRTTIGHLGVPRGGYVGFLGRIQAKSGDRVDCVVTSTGQTIPPEPMVVSKAKAQRKSQ